MNKTTRNNFISNICKTIVGYFLLCTTISTTYANFESFLGTLEEAGINTQQVMKSPSLSRYETARILNMIECEDCLRPSPNMRNRYTPKYRSDFSILPTKSFDDIDRGKAEYNNNSYYYCVAYVGDKGYMKGYDRGSPFCAGEFCGTNKATQAEYFQMLLNMMSDGVYKKIRAPWSQMSNNSNKMETYYQDIIKKGKDKCTKKSCILRNQEELQAYLAYCRNDLKTCDMEPISGIEEGAWPVSEVNFLIQTDIISKNEITKNIVTENISGRKALELAYQAFSKNTCIFNNDYDCDGWKNNQDNCQDTYNPSQTDTDNDGIGDVCDEDIDNDGLTNTKGIVDERNTIDISKIKDTKDNCIRDPDPKAICDRMPKGSIGIEAKVLSQEAGVLSHIEAITTKNRPGPITRKINGTLLSQTGTKIIYEPKESNLYFIEASQPSLAKTTMTASSSVRIAKNPERTYIKRKKTQTVKIKEKARTKITHLTDAKNTSYARTINGKKINNETNNIIIPPKKGTYNITAKTNDSSISTKIQCNENFCTSINIESNESREVNEKYTITANIGDIKRGDIFRIKRSDGKNSRYTNSAKTEFIPSKEGAQSIKVVITLMDGTTYTQKIKKYVTIKKTKQDEVFNYSTKKGDEITEKNKEIITKKTTENISQCVVLQSSESTTEKNKAEKKCYELYKSGDIKKYKCDMDGDGTPDICDSDIDNDGIKNPIGIITKENPDCSITDDIIDRDLLDIGFNNLSCSIDNCPFTINKNQTDTNKDGIGNICESKDFDNDGILNNLDLDDDNDTIPDKKEKGPDGKDIDTDNDGMPDHKDTDADNDGIRDMVEVGNKKENIKNADKNKDGKVDKENNFGKNGLRDPIETKNESGKADYNNDKKEDDPLNSDKDENPDFQDIDSDDDGIGDMYEKKGPKGGSGNETTDTDGDGIPDYRDLDADDDGILDSDESEAREKPRDSDHDGIPDFQDTDKDNDGIPDKDDPCPYSAKNICTPEDADGDGIPNKDDLCPYDTTNRCIKKETPIRKEIKINNITKINNIQECVHQTSHIKPVNCDMCPCQAVGFDAQIQPGDSVRAKLRDIGIEFGWASSSPRMIEI